MSLLLFAAAAIVPAGETFACTPTHVWDGDGPHFLAGLKRGAPQRAEGLSLEEGVIG